MQYGRPRPSHGRKRHSAAGRLGRASSRRAIESSTAANLKANPPLRSGSARLSILVVAGILLILTTAFGSARDALIIMLNLPLALVGGVLGVYFSGGVLSVASIIGFITLFGIATRNGIMLVSHIRHLIEKEGVTDLREAVLRGRVGTRLADSDDRPGGRPGTDTGGTRAWANREAKSRRRWRW